MVNPSPTRQPLVTAVAIKRPLTGGFRLLLLAILLIAVTAAVVAWHSERQHRRAKSSVKSLGSELSHTEQQLQALQARQDAQAQQLRDQQALIDTLVAGDPGARRRWLAGRVADTVAVAEQLLAARQIAPARLLLRRAEQLLTMQPVPALQGVQRALAEDRLRLERLSQPDVSGIYQRLDALDARLRALDLPRDSGQRVLPASPAQPVAVGSWLDARWRQVRAFFDGLVVIRHYDRPLQPVLDPARRQQLRDHYSLLVDQARLALLRADQPLFDAALVNLDTRLRLDLSTAPSDVTQPLHDSIAALRQEPVGLTLPTLSTPAALEAILPGAGGPL